MCLAVCASCLSASGLVCECVSVRRVYVCLHKLAMYNQQLSGGKLEVECLLALWTHVHTHTQKLTSPCAVTYVYVFCVCSSVYAINVLCDGDLNCVSFLEERTTYLI